MSLLEQISQPADLKEIKISELPHLASEIRQTIIDTVSKTGGHLASSLGVVELTIALLRTFDLTHDKIIWDVGHQCYAHKILTGRREKFDTLRQHEGLSGFPKICECRYDCFGTGHASTSISAALGMAKARDIKGEDFKVIAIIGDGSLTGGMAFEALNNAGHTKTNLIVILNDNEMSISPTVGGILQHIEHLRTTATYNRFRGDVADMVARFGKRATRLIKRIDESAKTLFVDNMLFDSLGFRYFGPIDGHNIVSLISILQRVKNIGGPIVVHVVTKKGRGYDFAETNPTKFHGSSSFDISTGQSIKKKKNITYTDAFSKALMSLASKDRRIVAITAAMLDGTGMSDFQAEYPDRCFDVGIAEQHAVTFAAGLASQCMKPILAVYSTFLQRGYDQIVHDVCLQNLPVTFALDRAGLVGADGPTHHGTFDFAYLRHIPNMVVMAPKDEAELQHMLKTAIDHDGPIALRYPRGEAIGVSLPDELMPLPIGRAEIIKDGHDILLLAIGSMVYPAIEASEILERNNISTAVINARFVKPLDKELIHSLASRIGKIITIEEHVIDGGFGSAVMEMIAESEDLSDIKIKLMGLPDQFIEQGDQKILLAKHGLTPKSIVQSAMQMLGCEKTELDRISMEYSDC